jgi:hypothetical protein
MMLKNVLDKIVCFATVQRIIKITSPRFGQIFKWVQFKAIPVNLYRGWRAIHIDTLKMVIQGPGEVQFIKSKMIS